MQKFGSLILWSEKKESAKSAVYPRNRFYFSVNYLAQQRKNHCICFDTSLVASPFFLDVQLLHHWFDSNRWGDTVVQVITAKWDVKFILSNPRNDASRSSLLLHDFVAIDDEVHSTASLGATLVQSSLEDVMCGCLNYGTWWVQEAKEVSLQVAQSCFRDRDLDSMCAAV